MKIGTMGGMAVVTALLWAGGVAAQDAGAQDAGGQEAPAEEALSVRPGAASEWGVFSRGETRRYLIDATSVQRNGDEASIMVARISTTSAAGDYSHTLDRFEVRCRARQIHVVSTTDVAADGTPDQPYATDEPWEAISPGSFDSAIHEIACDNAVPQPPSYATVKAYIDAGRL